MKSTRGAIQFVPIIILLLVCAGGVELYRVFAPGRNKQKIDQVAQAVVTNQTQALQHDDTASKVKEAVADSQKQHAVEIAAHEKVQHNAAGFVTAAQQALETDTSEEAVAAKELQQDALDSLGSPLTPEEVVKYSRLAKGLLQKNAEIQAELAAAKQEAIADRAALDSEKAHSKSSDEKVTTLVVQNKNQAGKLVVSATTIAKQTASIKTWADGEETWMDRIKALGGFAVIAVLVAVLLAIKFFGAKNVLTDTVALLEHVKSAAVGAGHDAVALETKIHDWWEGSKNEQKVAAIKTDVLRQ